MPRAREGPGWDRAIRENALTNHIYDFLPAAASHDEITARVADVLALHQLHFGDTRMEADDGEDRGQERSGPVLAGADNGEQDTPARRQDDDHSDDGLGDAGKRAIQEERKRAREAKTAAKTAEERAAAAEARLAEIEREQLNAQERAELEAADWKKKYEENVAALAARDLDILRRDVADEKGLNPGLARRLRGATREELEQDAEELKSMFGAVTAPPAPGAPRVPKPDPSAGATGSGGRPTSVAEAMRDIRAQQQR